MESKIIIKNMISNFLGVFIYLFSQWLVTVLVVRLSGNYEDAGALSLAMSVTSVFSLIGYYSVRNYQVSDINNEFSDSEYVQHRIVFCLIANIALMIFLIIMKYDMPTFAIVFAYMMYRNCEIIIDVFHAIDQKRWRMDIIGISYLIRGGLGLAAFCIAEYCFKDLLMAIFAMTIVSVVCLYFVDVVNARKLCNITMKLNIASVKKLTILCFPLFCYGILSNIIVAIPKIYFEYLFGTELLGYYASVAAPAIIVQTVATYIFSPLIPIFSDYYQKKDKRFISLFIKISIVILVLGIFTAIISYFLGDWMLCLIFGKDILKYSGLFVSIIILSMITAMTWFAGTLLIVIRNNKCLVAGSLIGVILCGILTVFLIPQIGMNGINIATLFAMIAEYLIFCTTMLISIKKRGEFLL